jgi:hypothetical protein
LSYGHTLLFDHLADLSNDGRVFLFLLDASGLSVSQFLGAFGFDLFGSGNLDGSVMLSMPK